MKCLFLIIFVKICCFFIVGFCFFLWKVDKYECGGVRLEGDDVIEKRWFLNVNRLNDCVSEWYNWIVEWLI